VQALKKIYRTIFPKNPIDDYIKRKNIVVGNNCNISKLTVSIPAGHDGKTNLIIGSDCVLECHIVIYNPDAQVIIGDRVYIGPQTTFFCNEKIELEGDILVSWSCTLIDSNAHPLKWEHRKNDVINWRNGTKDWTHVENKPIVVKRKSWLGFNSILMKGVTVGEGSVVAAGSVVTKDVEPFTIVGGNPASFIKNTE
jgi:acetyltransferase-like isoleucine patch superfamily enzyme